MISFLFSGDYMDSDWTDTVFNCLFDYFWKSQQNSPCYLQKIFYLVSCSFFQVQTKEIECKRLQIWGSFSGFLVSFKLLNPTFFSNNQSCSSTFDNRFDEKLGNESRRTSKARLTFRTRWRSRSFLKLKSMKKIIFDPVFNYSFSTTKSTLCGIASDALYKFSIMQKEIFLDVENWRDAVQK